MRCIHVIAVLLLLLGCEQREPVLTDDEFVALQEFHPGMVQSCLEDVRYGGVVAWRPFDPNCYEMLPAQRWSGLWQHGWESTNFCPEPAEVCDWATKRGTWLIFADDVQLDEDLPDGIHRIEFVGRRTKIRGNYGHGSGYDHLMIVDQIISLEPFDL